MFQTAADVLQSNHISVKCHIEYSAVERCNMKGQFNWFALCLKILFSLNHMEWDFSSLLNQLIRDAFDSNELQGWSTWAKRNALTYLDRSEDLQKVAVVRETKWNWRTDVLIPLEPEWGRPLLNYFTKILKILSVIYVASVHATHPRNSKESLAERGQGN